MAKKNAEAEVGTAANPQKVVIAAPNFKTISIKIRGTAPLVVNRFSMKAQEEIRRTQEQGDTPQKKKRKPKDFDLLYRESFYQSEAGWYGVHAAAFRNACISACRVAGFQMTRAKLSVFVIADGFDAKDGTPLVRITSGKPYMWIAPARNDNGSIDLRARARWDEWSMSVTIRFDGDQFSQTDVVNLFARAGVQVGICEGRPDSTNSNGTGFGTFEPETETASKAA